MPDSSRPNRRFAERMPDVSRQTTRRDAIQRVLASHPRAPTEKIVRLLQAQGFTVNPDRIAQLRAVQSIASPRGAKAVGPVQGVEPTVSPPLQDRVQIVRQVVAQHPQATAQELRELLKRRGLEVQAERAARVKQSLARRNPSRPAIPGSITRREPGKQKPAGPVADELEKHGEAIRQALVAHPDALPREIVQQLRGQGVEVHLPSVQRVKNDLPGEHRFPRRNMPNPPSADPVLLRAQKFVQTVGGLARAKQLLDHLAKTMSRG